MGELIKYYCSSCNEKAELIIGGTMSASIEPKVCTHCKILINKTTGLRRVSDHYFHYLNKEFVEDMRKGMWHMSHKGTDKLTFLFKIIPYPI